MSQNETKCIACGTSPAYIGFMGKCECSSPKCKNYSPGLYPQDVAAGIVDDNALANAKNSPEEKPTTLDEKDIQRDTGHRYIWRTHHYDHGDV